MNAANTPAGLLPAALNLWHLGFTPLPVAPDGTKRPAVNSWRQHQDERPDAQTVVGWFTGRDVDGLGIVCGAASGNLEMLELEGRAVAEGVLARLETAFADHDAAELWQRVAAGYVERTPSGGIHWHYRTPGPAKGNTRLARRPATPDELAANPGDRVKVLIETRGQGGFTVCAPSGGRTHTTGRPWEVITGTAADVPTITDAERDLIHAVCSTLDATPSPAPDLPVTGRPQAAPAAVGDDVRPGDDYNQRTDWADLLAPHGWTLANTRGRVREWTRPGKSPRDGISATTGHAEDADRLFVFSSSTEFAPEVPYSKFGAYAVLEHGGDMQAAARALAAAGYGTPRDPERLTLDGKHPKAPVAAREPSGGPRDAATARRLLAALLADLRGWQHLPDPTHVVASLAAAITRDSNGEPVWLLLVAPPSSGKTETVRMLDDVAAARLDEVTSAGLIGWSRGKTAEPCGVLVRVGNSGLVTFGDLSSLLATSDRGGRDQVFGLLRRAYDGHVTRDVSPPGRTNADGRLEWSGRLTVVACVTGAIDRYTAHADALGPRWVYVRIPERTTADKRNAALLARRGGLAQHRADARRGVAAILAAAPTPEPHELPDAIADAIEDAALVTAWGRANVPRNGYGRRDIEGVPIVEEPMRLVQQLGALAAGVLALGLPDAAAATIARRVALDSMPEARRAVLDALAQARTDGELLNTSAVGRRAGLDRKVARYQLEELAAVGVVEHDRADDDTDELTGAVHWQLAGPDGQLIADVFSAHNTAGGWDEMWV